jgi:hypothetical protein
MQIVLVNDLANVLELLAVRQFDAKPVGSLTGTVGDLRFFNHRKLDESGIAVARRVQRFSGSSVEIDVLRTLALRVLIAVF